MSKSHSLLKEKNQIYFLLLLLTSFVSGETQKFWPTRDGICTTNMGTIHEQLLFLLNSWVQKYIKNLKIAYNQNFLLKCVFLQRYLCDNHSKNALLQANHAETPDKPKLRDILQK